jgi:DNA polymerase phi
VAITSTTSHRRASTDQAHEDAEKALKSKYSTGDLGDKVSADLNYTLKRLIRGLYSDNHQVKQGFFLASVLVLTKFKSLIDFEKYLKHMFAETKINQGMKSSEAHNMALGRMMCLSACIEGRIFLTG